MGKDSILVCMDSSIPLVCLPIQCSSYLACPCRWRVFFQPPLAGRSTHERKHADCIYSVRTYMYRAKRTNVSFRIGCGDICMQCKERSKEESRRMIYDIYNYMVKKVRDTYSTCFFYFRIDRFIISSCGFHLAKSKRKRKRKTQGAKAVHIRSPNALLHIFIQAAGSKRRRGRPK